MKLDIDALIASGEWTAEYGATVRQIHAESARKKAAIERRTRLYFVEAPAIRLIKIGFSQDVKQRFAAIDTGSPVDVRLLGWVPGLRAHERVLHERFASARIRGEWFSADVVRPFIVELLARKSAGASAYLNQLLDESERAS